MVQELSQSLDALFKLIDLNGYLLSNRGQPIFDSDAVKAQKTLSTLMLIVDDILV